MDQTIIIIVGVFLSVIIATLIADFLIRKRHSKQLDNLNIEDKIMRLSQDALKNNNEQFLVLAKEVLGAEKGNIKIDLEGN